MEGMNPFPKDSDPLVATYDEYSKPKSKYSSSGSAYGVSSHKVEDNWICDYCGTINSEGTYIWDSWKRTNKRN